MSALLAVLSLAACSKPEQAQEPVRSVKVLTVASGTLQDTSEFSAEVRAPVESRLGFRVGGKIVQRLVDVGQRVRPGQLLAQLDAQDLRLATDSARAQLAAAGTNRDLAAADLRRYQGLREQNFISGAELERRESTARAAQAALDQAQAQLSAQGNQAGYARLVADVAGVVTAVEAEAGQVVAAGAPVLRVAQDGARDAVFAVPEDVVGALRPGMPAQVRVWADDRRLTGTLREVGASADPVTRTFSAKVALPAQDAPALGTTVYVRLQGPAAPAGVIKLPTSALRREGTGTAVWVLDTATMTVRSQAIDVATLDGNQAVVSRGLAPGMQVVAAGVHVLSPGQKVTVWRAPGAAAVPQAGAR